MNIYQHLSLAFDEGDDVSVQLGQRSISNILPDTIRLSKLDNSLIQLEWKKYIFILHPDNRIGYWNDGFTGCEYDGFDKKRVDTDNQHMLEFAHEVLEELGTLIEKRGLYGNRRKEK